MDRDSFIPYIKTEQIYLDTLEDVIKTFYTGNYKLERPLPWGKSKKYWINEKLFGGNIMTDLPHYHQKI